MTEKTGYGPVKKLVWALPMYYFVEKQPFLCGAIGTLWPRVKLTVGPDRFFDRSIHNFLCRVNSLLITYSLVCTNYDYILELNAEVKFPNRIYFNRH